MDGEFKHYHPAVVDLLDKVEALEREQAILEDQGDKAANLFKSLASVNAPIQCDVRVKEDPWQHLFSDCTM